MEQETRKLTTREKFGVFSAIIMFLSIGMMMGGGKSGNMTLQYSGAGLFTLGAVIAVWLIVESNKNQKDEDDELFQ
jgi:hypothetical protein